MPGAPRNWMHHLRFIKEIIPIMIDKLNELAKAIVLETNSVHRNGYSLTNVTNLNPFLMNQLVLLMAI